MKTQASIIFSTKFSESSPSCWYYFKADTKIKWLERLVYKTDMLTFRDAL